MYFLAAAILFFLIYPATPDHVYLSRLDFSACVSFELVLFFFIFFCFISYFRAIKKSSAAGDLTSVNALKHLFSFNLISLFISYASLLTINFLSYCYAPFLFFRAFYLLRFNLHSQEFTLMLVKIFYLFVAAAGIYMIGKYFINGRVGFHYLCLSALGV